MIVPLVMPPPHILVPHYLMHCYLYYEHGTSCISDHDFDLLAKELVAHWKEAEGHRHAGLIDYNSLVAGSSGYYIDYPVMVMSAATSLLRIIDDRKQYPCYAGGEERSLLPDKPTLAELAGFTDRPTLAEVYEK